MTLEEKFWQLFMIPGSLDDPSHDYSQRHLRSADPRRGSARARAHAERINAIQRYFVEQTRLGIPIIPVRGSAARRSRGRRHVFPQAIALAATWDTALMGRVALAIARETGSRGIRQVLSPVINLADDVRWGRVEETYGEDPYSDVGDGARVHRGPSSERVSSRRPNILWPTSVMAAATVIRSITASVSSRSATFRRSARRRCGRASVMTAYNSVDGIPATQSRWLLNDMLKRDWDFTGFVISDAAATGGATVLHTTEANTASATKHALESGLDVIFQSSYHSTAVTSMRFSAA